MVRINHELAKLRERVRRDNMDTHRATRIFKWEEIGFGKHGELTLPELIFSRIDYFYWLLTLPNLRDSLQEQGKIIASRAAHIQPKGRRKDRNCFLVTAKSSGELRDIFALPIQHSDFAEYPMAPLQPHLDLSIIDQFGRHRRAAAESLRSWLIEEYFEGEAPTRQQCHDFFMNDDNFALTCTARHGHRHCVMEYPEFENSPLYQRPRAK